MSDTRSRRQETQQQQQQQQPILPPSNEIRSSGLGSEDSFSEATSAAMKNYPLDGKNGQLSVFFFGG